MLLKLVDAIVVVKEELAVRLFDGRILRMYKAEKQFEAEDVHSIQMKISLHYGSP